MSIQVLLAPTHLFALGLNWWHILLALLLSSLVVVLPFTLLGAIGARYHLPAAMIVRASFGLRGAVLVNGLRGLYASIAFGMFVWLGAQLLYGMVLAWGVPQVEERLGGADAIPAQLRATPGQLVAFGAYWLVTVAFGMLGGRQWRVLAAVKVILVGLFLLVLIMWASIATKQGGPLLQEVPFGSDFGATVMRDGAAFARAFGVAVGASTGFWFLFAMNISDYTRFARSVSSQTVGQGMRKWE